MDFTLPLTPKYTQTGGTTNAATSLFGDYAVAATIAFTLVVFLFEAYLNFRQRKSYHKTEFPRELETTVGNIDRETKSTTTTSAAAEKKGSEEHNKDKVDRNAPLLPQLKSKFAKAQSYGLDKINFSIFSSIYALTEEVVFLLYGFLPYVWDKACNVGSKYGWTETENEIKITLIFLGIVTIIGTITSLPFELYSTFEIEKKHGFNKMTLGLFVTDKIKGLVLQALFGGPFVALLLKIIFAGGEKFYLYVWAFTFVFSVIMMTLVPVVIMPLFNKYEKLPEGPLKDSIYDLAGKLSFPLTKLFVMDGSKRSSHSVSSDLLFLIRVKCFFFGPIYLTMHIVYVITRMPSCLDS
jgi:STE24 endopeptidase